MKKINSKYINFGNGTNQLNSRKIPANYDPSNYTPDQVDGEGSDKVSAHLKGLDVKVAGGGGTIDFYEESVLITNTIGNSGAGWSADHKTITLPNGKTYNGTIDALEVFIGDNLDGGLGMVEGIDFDYENNITAITVIFYKALPQNIRIKFRLVGMISLTFYDESLLVTTSIGVAGAGYNTAHTEFTLPNGKTYDGTKNELVVFAGDNLDGGLSLVSGVDFNYENNVFATKIITTKAIPKNIRMRFRLLSA